MKKSKNKKKDYVNLMGAGNIVNPDNIDGNVNHREVENKFTSGNINGSSFNGDVKSLKSFNIDKAMKEGLEDLYSNFQEMEDLFSNKSDSVISNSEDEYSDEENSEDYSSDEDGSDFDSDNESDEEDDFDSDNDNFDNESVYSSMSNRSSVIVKTMGQDNQFSNAYSNNLDPRTNFITEEQKKRECITSVINNLDTVKNRAVIDLQKEQEEDLKLSYLADIKIFMQSLEDDGKEIKIKMPDTNSSFKEVKQIHKILQRMVDHQRYCSFANEFILFGANCLEFIFDGEKEYFGYKPDLTDWSCTVQSKLPRMKVDTTKIVSDFVQDYNIHPLLRIGMELVPSAISHSRLRASQHDEEDIHSQPIINNAMNQMNHGYY